MRKLKIVILVLLLLDAFGCAPGSGFSGVASEQSELVIKYYQSEGTVDEVVKIIEANGLTDAFIGEVQLPENQCALRITVKGAKDHRLDMVQTQLNTLRNVVLVTLEKF
jgi:hypothetical protein